MYSVGDAGQDAGNVESPNGQQVFRVWSDGQGTYVLRIGEEMSLSAFRDVVFEGDRGACLTFVSQRLAPEPADTEQRPRPIPQAMAAA
ncbi:hypothetical protein [Longimicrobium sp.]|jgi:hypothetical protein|uniref:hypothetical protein n=1 Tax=Longimicrobium sp. TaxID=2029185 RepID=UPI002ED8132C